MGSYENYAQEIETNEEHDFSIKRTSVKNFKEMEKDWQLEKKELRDQLSAKLDSMHIKANNLSEFAFADFPNK